VSLAKTFFTGVRWNTLSTILSSLGHIVLLGLAARLLSAEEIGFLAVGLIWMRLTLPLVDLGLGNAIIQAEELTMKEARGLNILQVLVGSALLILTLIGLYYLPLLPSKFMAARDLVAGFSLVLLIAPLGLASLALVKRQLRFATLGKVQVTAYLIEIAVGVALLFHLRSAMGFVWAYLARHSVMALGGLAATKFTLMRFSAPQIRPDLIRFGLFDMAGLLANQAGTQLDKLLVGGFLGPASLGIYTMAWDLLIQPLSRLAGVVNQALFPIFSSIQKEAKNMGMIYHKVLEIQWWIGLGVGMVFWGLSPLLVKVVYGPEWAMIAPIILILIPAALIKVLAYPGATVVLSRGRPDLILYWNVLWTLLLLGTTAIGLSLSPDLETAAWCLVLASIVFTGIWHLMVYRVGGFSASDFPGIVLKGLGYILVPFLLVHFFAPQVIIVIIGLVLYAATLMAFEKTSILSLKDKIRI
jgi:O-antigen/teichoic acid export membrane protein